MENPISAKNKFYICDMEDTDGIHHINIYSKGLTEVGKWLSNFTYCPIKTQHGNFKSIEGYWYWLSSQNESLRLLHGFSAKKLGKESPKVQQLSEDEFRKYICQAIDIKLKTKPKWVAEQCNLPLKHYYDYGGKRIEKQEYNWITEHIQNRVNQLRVHYKL